MSVFFWGRKCGVLHQDYNIKDPKGGSAIIQTEPTIQKKETWAKNSKKNRQGEQRKHLN